MAETLHEFLRSYQPSADLLKERVILVTGAGDGIGRAVALGLAAHGATLVLLGKTIPKLEAVYDAIVAAGGPQPALYPMHLEGASPHDYQELADRIQQEFGRLDGLLHNAANLPYLSRIKDYDAEDWLRVMQVNCNAAFLMTQACLPMLLEAPDATILFTSDQVTSLPKAFWGAYGASKAAVDHLMRVLAEELEESRVRVNSIDPGPTNTALRRRAFAGDETSKLKAPEALLPWYLWLLGPDSTGTRGERLVYAP